MLSVARSSLLIVLLLIIPQAFALFLQVRDGCDAQCAVYTQAAECGTVECLCLENVAEGLQTCMDCSATQYNVQTQQRIIDSYNIVCGGKSGVESVTSPPVPTSTSSSSDATASVLSSIASQVVSAITSAAVSAITSAAISAITATSTESSVNGTASSTPASGTSASLTSPSASATATATGAKSGAIFVGPNALVGFVAIGMGMVLAV